MEEEKYSSFAIFRQEFSDISNMVEGKWHDSTAFYVQGSAWKVGIKINAEERQKYLGVYLRRCSSASGEDLLQEHFAEVVMSLLSQVPRGPHFRREYQQKFNGEKKANYGWPQFKPWHEVVLPKNGFVLNDTIILEVYLAAAPPVTVYGDVPGMHPRRRPLSCAGLAAGEEGALGALGTMALEDSVGGPGAVGVGGVGGLTLEQRSQNVLDAGLGSDCDVVVTKDGVNAHSFRVSQIMLARASPVFEKMFFSEPNPKSCIEITEADPDAFYCLLQFAYNCNWEFKTYDEAVDVYYLANRFVIQELQSRAVEYIWPTSIDNVWSALNVSTHFPEPELKVAAVKVISENTKAAFAHPSFLKISRRSIIAILEQTQLQVDSELEVFLAAKNWAHIRALKKGLSDEGRHLRAELGRAIKYIRFLALTAQEFIGHPMESGILTPEECVVLLRSLNNREKFLPCPHLCSLRSQRKKVEETKRTNN